MNAIVSRLRAHESRILRAQGLSLGQVGGVALEQISFTAWPGELTTLIGPQQAGKTALLNVLAATLWPDSGEVWLGRHSLAALPVEQRQREICLIASARWPAPRIIVAEAVQPPHASFWGRFIRRFVRPDPLPQTAAALAAVGLLEKVDVPVARLDAYERVAVRLARALMQDAGVILLEVDELGLDPLQLHRLQHLLRRIAAPGRTIVQSLAALDCAFDYADRLLLLKEGRLLYEGGIEGLLSGEHLSLAFEAPFAIHRDALGWRLKPILLSG